MLRSEILKNRQIVVEYLQKPSRRKAKNKLDVGDGNRCCLGHMCFVLGIDRWYDDLYNQFKYGKNGDSGEAPDELLELVGLYNDLGGLGDGMEMTMFPQRKKDVSGHRYYVDSLAEVNDDLRVSPQQIGAYLATVIEGGINTPWRPLSEYPEA